MKIKKENIKYYVLLHVIIFLYSLGGIASKFASRQELFSFKFFLFYGIVILNLFIYALVWQQVLKHIPLTTAYANKSMTVVWGMLIGLVVFNEAITLTKIIGAAIVLAGVIMVVKEDG